MKSKIIYLLTIICVLLASISFYQLDHKTKRIHQHLDSRWQKNISKNSSIFQTHLPIITLNTHEQKIPGAPIITNNDTQLYETGANGETSIEAEFTIIDEQKGSNKLTDKTSLKTNSLIHYRGNSSRHFDKKSYSIHFIDNEGKENKKELAGMYKHDEWILNGPFLDRSLLRNYLCFNISGEIMSYAPNVRFCELYVNDNYQGIYLLMEPISRSEGRINITKPSKNNDLTSFIVRFDRQNKSTIPLDNYSYYTYKTGESALDVLYPGKNLISEGRKKYIQKQIDTVERILYSIDLWSNHNSYSKYLDTTAFAQYFIINEFFRNVDAGNYSTYYYKDIRGKIKPCVWDFNNSCDNYIDDVWNEEGFSLIYTPWFSQLIKDKDFVYSIVRIYHQLRKSILSEDYLIEYIDNTNTWLDSAIQRNDEVWGYVYDLNNYNELNYLKPVERNIESHDEAVEQLKDYLIQRGRWLDKHIESLYQYCSESKNANEMLR
ncbi:MAG: CotH kinase family protein [Thomasclavelia sp.]|uniref:CotH kinase family protein n=1 Tax=Thomasclavelia sp. TaxID=3025757 RepID=UPI00399F1084